MNATPSPKEWKKPALLLGGASFWRLASLVYVLLATALVLSSEVRVQFDLVDSFPALSAPTQSDWPRAIWDGLLGRHGKHPLEYRPLVYLLGKALYDLAGGPDLLTFRIAHALAFGLLGAAMVWFFRPRSLAEFLAFSISYHSLLGLHSAGVFYVGVPGSVVLINQVLIFAALALLRTGGGKLADLAGATLALAALLFSEYGILVGVVLVAGSLLGYRGVSLRGAAGVLLAVAVYGVLRMGVIPWMGGAVPRGGRYQFETGFLCGKIDASAQQALFGDFPYFFYLYNIVANGMTVLFSEPRAGIFAFACNVLVGKTHLFQWVMVITSLLSTALIALWLVQSPPKAPDKQFVLVVSISFLVNIGLGFLYARDRVPAHAGAAYALLLYLALRHWFAWLAAGPRLTRPLVGLAIALLMVGWSWRVVATFYSLRHYAWDVKQEWQGPRYERARAQLAGDAPRLALLETLRNRALRQELPDPRYDPAWVRRLLTDR